MDPEGGHGYPSRSAPWSPPPHYPGYLPPLPRRHHPHRLAVHRPWPVHQAPFGFNIGHIDTAHFVKTPKMGIFHVFHENVVISRKWVTFLGHFCAKSTIITRCDHFSVKMDPFSRKYRYFMTFRSFSWKYRYFMTFRPFSVFLANICCTFEIRSVWPTVFSQ